MNQNDESHIENTLIRDLSENFLDHLSQDYFRATVIGLEQAQLNDQEPIIFVLNHSGTSYPWDGFIFGYFLNKILGRQIVINISEQTLNTPLISPADMFRRLGGVKNHLKSIEDNFQSGRHLIIFPEGTAGIAKGFNRRYRLQKYHKSFIYLAAKYKARVVPINVINAEFLLPFMYSFKWINQLSRAFGLAFLPIGLFTPFFIIPAFVYCAMPAKITFVFHQPFKFNFLNESDFKESSFLHEKTMDFQVYQQKLLNDDVKKYQKPYEWVEFFKSFIKSKDKKIFFPFFWHEYLCDVLKLGWHIRLFYKLPLIGWILLMIFLPKNKMN